MVLGHFLFPGAFSFLLGPEGKKLNKTEEQQQRSRPEAKKGEQEPTR
ncbi:protein of unknown function [Burkholderia multivorans]